MTDNQLIEALGGCNAVARMLGIKPSSVSGWKSIPTDRKIRLAVIAEEKGITTRKQLFPDSYGEIWIELREAFNSLNISKPVKELDEARRGVLLSMAFQMGTEGLLGFKNTLEMVRTGRYTDAAKGMLNSLWAKQTPQRAKRHSEQMRTGKWVIKNGY